MATTLIQSKVAATEPPVGWFTATHRYVGNFVSDLTRKISSFVSSIFYGFLSLFGYRRENEEREIEPIQVPRISPSNSSITINVNLPEGTKAEPSEGAVKGFLKGLWDAVRRKKVEDENAPAEPTNEAAVEALLNDSDLMKSAAVVIQNPQDQTSWVQFFSKFFLFSHLWSGKKPATSNDDQEASSSSKASGSNNVLLKSIMEDIKKAEKGESSVIVDNAKKNKDLQDAVVNIINQEDPNLLVRFINAVAGLNPFSSKKNELEDSYVYVDGVTRWDGLPGTKLVAQANVPLRHIEKDFSGFMGDRNKDLLIGTLAPLGATPIRIGDFEINEGAVEDGNRTLVITKVGQ